MTLRHRKNGLLSLRLASARLRESSPFFILYEDSTPNPNGDISNERPMGTFLLVDNTSLCQRAAVK